VIQLTTNLYQGNKTDADESVWQTAGITRILRVSAPHVRERDFFPKGDDFLYLWVPFDDNGETLTHAKLNTIYRFALLHHYDPLLVHCAAGQNRSVIVCAYLLCEVYNYTEDDAVKLILRKHNDLKVYETLVQKMKLLTGLNFRAYYNWRQIGHYGGITENVSLPNASRKHGKSFGLHEVLTDMVYQAEAIRGGNQDASPSGILSVHVGCVERPSIESNARKKQCAGAKRSVGETANYSSSHRRACSEDDHAPLRWRTSPCLRGRVARLWRWVWPYDGCQFR
jgi:hypothetical protein